MWQLMGLYGGMRGLQESVVNFSGGDERNLVKPPLTRTILNHSNLVDCSDTKSTDILFLSAKKDLGGNGDNPEPGTEIEIDFDKKLRIRLENNIFQQITFVRTAWYSLLEKGQKLQCDLDEKRFKNARRNKIFVTDFALGIYGLKQIEGKKFDSNAPSITGDMIRHREHGYGDPNPVIRLKEMNAEKVIRVFELLPVSHFLKEARE